MGMFFSLTCPEKSVLSDLNSKEKKKSKSFTNFRAVAKITHTTPDNTPVWMTP